MAISEQQLHDKVDAVTAQMLEMLEDYELEQNIWAHKVRDWVKVLTGKGLTVGDFAHYKDPKYPRFTVLPQHLQEFLDGKAAIVAMDEALKKVCPHCGQKQLGPAWGTEPWSVDHLACGACDSTFCVDDKGNPITPPVTIWPALTYSIAQREISLDSTKPKKLRLLVNNFTLPSPRRLCKQAPVVP